MFYKGSGICSIQAPLYVPFRFSSSFICYIQAHLSAQPRLLHMLYQGSVIWSIQAPLYTPSKVLSAPYWYQNQLHPQSSTLSIHIPPHDPAIQTLTVSSKTPKLHHPRYSISRHHSKSTAFLTFSPQPDLYSPVYFFNLSRLYLLFPDSSVCSVQATVFVQLGA